MSSGRLDTIVSTPLPLVMERYPLFRDVVNKMDPTTSLALKALWTTLPGSTSEGHPLRLNLERWEKDGVFEVEAIKSDAILPFRKHLPSADGGAETFSFEDAPDTPMTADQLDLFRLAYRILIGSSADVIALNTSQQRQLLAMVGIQPGVVSPNIALPTKEDLFFEDIARRVTCIPEWSGSSVVKPIAPTTNPFSPLLHDATAPEVTSTSHWWLFVSEVIGFLVALAHCASSVAAWSTSDSIYAPTLVFVAFIFAAIDIATMYWINRRIILAISKLNDLHLYGKGSTAFLELLHAASTQYGFVMYTADWYRSQIPRIVYTLTTSGMILLVSFCLRFTGYSESGSGMVFAVGCVHLIGRFFIARKVTQCGLHIYNWSALVHHVVQDTVHGNQDIVPHFLRHHFVSIVKCLGDPKHPLSDLWLWHTKIALEVTDNPLAPPAFFPPETTMEETWSHALHVVHFVDAVPLQKSLMVFAVGCVVITGMEKDLWSSRLSQYLNAALLQPDSVPADKVLYKATMLRKALLAGVAVTYDHIRMVVEEGVLDAHGLFLGA